MIRKRLRAVIFGPQGSGKGTQGQLLSERFGVPLIGAGDLFRAEIKEKTALGKLIEQYVTFGMLAPDELVNAIINKRLKEVAADAGFILEGYPRNVDQAESLDRLLKITLAIQLKISDRESVRRLAGRRQCPACWTVYHITDAPPAHAGRCSLCGRALIKREDDHEDTIKQRLAAYHFITEPLAAYYRQRGVLLAVNGEQSIPFLFEELVKKTAKLGFICP
jgi:adenylate kinase